MTASEAIKMLEIQKPAYGCKEYKKPLMYAYDMAMQALEKQIPKKPIFNHNLSDTFSLFHCECGHTIKVRHDIGIMDNNNAPNYCSRCGCRLDWSDEE